METKVNFNVWDITKSIALVFVILFVIFYSSKLYNNFSTNMIKNQESITKMVENTGMLIYKTADKSDFKDLVEELQSENNKLLDQIKTQQRHTKEIIDEIGVVKANIKATRDLYQSSTKTYDKEGQEYNHYEYKEIKNGGGKVAWVMYYPNREAEKRWKVGTFQLNTQTTVVESENKDGSYNRYVEIELRDKNDNEIPVTVNAIKWEKNPIKTNSFSFWNPRIALDINFSKSLDFGLDMSFMSYGKTDRDMIWRFIEFGVLTNSEMDDIAFSIQPLSWNIGEVLPIIENLFVGPSFTYGIKNNEMKYGFGISIPF